MYSSTSLQSLIYKILFLGGTNFTEVISSANTLSISINTSSTLSMGIIVWDDAFINSSSTVNYYKYRFVDSTLYRTNSRTKNEIDDIITSLNNNAGTRNIFINAMIYRMPTSPYHQELSLLCYNVYSRELFICDSANDYSFMTGYRRTKRHKCYNDNDYYFINNNFPSTNNNDEFPFGIIKMLRGVLKFNNNDGMIIKFTIS